MTSQEETKYCLESSFIIDLLKGNGNAVVVYEEIKNSPLTIAAIASVALFEILRGREENESKIQAFEELRRRLVILPFGKREAEEASRTEKELHDKGEKVHPFDLLIGITAKTNDAVLVTNDSGFEKIPSLRIKKY